LTKQKIVEIQIANNPNHTITKIQYPIQVTIDHTISHAQSLTLNHLVFDPTGVIKHGLKNIALFRIHSNKHLYLLSPLSNNFFYVDPIIKQEMFHLKTTMQYKPIFSFLKLYNLFLHLYNFLTLICSTYILKILLWTRIYFHHISLF
jgi:hypothetical protein